MNNPDLWPTPLIVPSLAYSDVPRAIDFLTRAFGFRERPGARLWGTGWMLTWLEIGDALIHLATAGGHDIHSPSDVGRSTQSLKVYVDDIDGHFARAKAAGAVIISEPADMFWGGRIYRAKDHEGHHWEFSQIGCELAAKHWKLPDGVHRED